MAKVAGKKSKRQAKMKVAKKKSGARRGAKKRVSKKRNADTKKKPVRKKAAKKKVEKNKAKKKAKKKVVKKTPAKKAPAPPMSIEATRLAIAVRETEQVLEKTSTRLAGARERVVRTATTARLKRTQAAHAVADRAREEVALVNERRVSIAIRLREAHEAIGQQHKADLDWHKLEHALKEAIERYEEALKASDRRVARARERRNR